MIRPLLIGIVAGARAISPVAAVAAAGARGQLPEGNGAPALLGHPLVAVGALAMAVGEMVGDKWSEAPDRIVASGMVPRIVSAGLSGAALEPRENRVAAALVAIAVAVAAAHLTFQARTWALRRYGQVATGAIEDVLVLAATTAIVRSANPQAA